MTTIGSIGIGLFILIITWILALLLFVIGIKLQSNIAWIALVSATLLTVILVVIPTKKPYKTESNLETEDKDYILIYKTILLLFLICIALIAFLVFFILHCIEPVRAKPINSFYIQ